MHAKIKKISPKVIMYNIWQNDKKKIRLYIFIYLFILNNSWLLNLKKKFILFSFFFHKYFEFCAILKLNLYLKRL